MNRVIVITAAAVFAVLIFLVRPDGVSSHETLTTTVLFDREIVQVLNRHCVMCHSANGPSFPLETYEQTWLRGRQIRASVIARHMPPWSAVSGYGQFANDNGLTLRETQFVTSWVEGLGPRNAGAVFTNIADSNAPRRKDIRAEDHSDHWRLGEPDIIRKLSADTGGSTQSLSVKRVVVDLQSTSDLRVRALEFRPGDRRFLHAAFFTVQQTGQWIGSWTPWYGSSALPQGAIYRLPRGAKIVAEFYYARGEERLVDQGSLGLFLADQQANAPVDDLTMEARMAAPRKFHAETRLTRDSDVLALRPEIVEGLTSIEVSVRKPDGGTEVLLFAKDFNLDWPAPYVFKEPVRIAKSAVLSLTAHFNSTAPLPASLHLTVSRK
jgi:hypothetical protein